METRSSVDVYLNALADVAVAQRETLLLKFPKLQTLQDEIESRVSQCDTLEDRLAGLVAASESFRSNGYT